jgi:filamentous hemagglutinin family protein
MRDCYFIGSASGIIWATIFSCGSAWAQSVILPDETLGVERSTVAPAVIQGLPSDRIDGGVIRGGNLFHSFQQFNIDEGRGVYFANPVGIENILSRVTGIGRSEIFGRLGVLGNANLFLLNPNGIVFGPNSDLDITGSFTVTTANAIQLGDRSFFSATQPQQSSLLSVTPGALFWNSVVNQKGTIENSGNLLVGKNLSVSGTNLDLTGQVQAQGNLILRATDTLKIRDSASNPFVAAAGGKLLVQGDKAVDIFALNHPNSGMFSGGDMVLRSATPVIGDAHYYSGGNFRIENLEGNGGGLFSPNDPVLIARGDVSFNFYRGASLHIFAGGNVEITTGVQVIAPDFIFGWSEDVVLSDGTTVAIRGANQPTVDIRAGIDDPSLLIGEGVLNAGNGGFTTGVGQVLSNIPTGSNIDIGVITFNDGATLIGGNVLLTNQYRPNRNLPDGLIRISAIPSLEPGAGIAIQTNSAFGNAGDVVIDSRGDIQVRGVIAANSVVAANGGNVRLIAGGNIDLAPTTFTSPQGDVNRAIQSVGLVGGNINLMSGENISLDRSAILSNSFATTPSRKSGSITLNANSILLKNDSRISASNVGGAEAGDINLFANNVIEILGANSFIQSDTGVGTPGGGTLSDTLASGGNITLRTGSLLIDDGAISALTFNRGNAGNIDNQWYEPTGQAPAGISPQGAGNVPKEIQAGDDIVLQNRARIANDVQPGSTGNGGVTSIRADSLDILSGSQITSTVVSTDTIEPLIPPARGNSGRIDLRVNGAMKIDGDKDNFFSGIFTAAQPGTIGNGGDIRVAAGSLRIQSNGIGAGIFTNVAGNGDAGNVDVDVDGSLQLSGFRALLSSVVNEGGRGNSGNITVNANSIQMTDFSGIGASHAGVGRGRAGNISIHADDRISLSDRANIQSGKGVEVIGRSGDIEITASTLTLQTGGVITTSALDVGDSGNIRVIVSGDASINGFSAPISIPGFGASPGGGSSGITSNSVTSNESDINLPSFVSRAFGNSGNIYFSAQNLTLSNGGTINNAVTGRGDSGLITVEIADNLVIRGLGPRIPSSIISQIDQIGTGNAGAVTVKTGQLSIESGGTINSANLGRGNAGNVTVNVRGNFSANNPAGESGQFDSATISTRAERGSGGSIDLSAQNIRLNGNSDIVTFVNSGEGNGGNIRITANSIVAFSDSDILAFAQDGRGGNVSLNTRAFFGQNWDCKIFCVRG